MSLKQNASISEKVDELKYRVINSLSWLNWKKENLQISFRRHFFVTTEMRSSILENVKFLYIPFLCNTPQAAGSTSLKVNDQATKTEEKESAKNKISSCEQFSFFCRTSIKDGMGRIQFSEN